MRAVNYNFMLKQAFLTIIFSFLMLMLSAQRNVNIYEYNPEGFDKEHIVDTVFDNLYLNHIFLQSDGFVYNTGLVGFPSKSVEIKDFIKPDFLSEGSMPVGSSFGKRYYHTYSPFSKIEWFNAAKKEQTFHVLHTQNVKEKLNFGLELDIAAGDGFYATQAYRNTLFKPHVSYSGKKYNIKTFLVTSKSTGDVSGGYFKEQLQGNFTPQAIQSRIVSGKGIRSDLKFLMDQSLNIVSPDSSSNTALKFGLIASYDKISHDFSGNDTAFGLPVFRNPLNTNDSLSSKKSALGVYLNFLTSNNNIKVSSGIENNHYYSQTELMHYSGKYQNLYADAKYMLSDSVKSFSLYGKYYFSGRKSGDFNVSGKVAYKTKKKYQYFLSGGIKSEMPSPLYSNIIVNHLYYSDIERNPVKNVFAVAGLEGDYQLLAKVRLDMFNDILFFDEQFNLIQDSEVHYGVGFSLSKNFKLGKWIFGNRLLAQYVTSSNISVPAYCGYHSIAYSGNIKKIVDFIVGADFSGYTKYKTYNYLPANGIYYLSDVYSGNYPVVGVFLNLKRKRASFYLNYRHLNYGTAGENFFTVNAYPLVGNSFRMGIKWAFYD